MNSRKIVNGLVVVCVFLCCPCTAISLVGGGAFVAGAFQEPENVNIGVHAPAVVAKGESFVIEVRVENLVEQPQLLDSIDISLGYLDGIDIQKAEPPFVKSWDIPNTDWRSYEFRQNIPPDSKLVVRFWAVGLKEGGFSGEIDVCINSGMNCSRSAIQTVVE